MYPRGARCVAERTLQVELGLAWPNWLSTDRCPGW